MIQVQENRRHQYQRTDGTSTGEKTVPVPEIKMSPYKKGGAVYKIADQCDFRIFICVSVTTVQSYIINYHPLSSCIVWLKNGIFFYKYIN